MISLEGVSKRLGGNEALRSVTLRLERGRTTALIGPSGCGKSTLLRLLIGLLRPDSGILRFDGEAVTAENIRRLRHRMGYVIQEGGLFPHLTAQGNVILAARHLGWPDGRITDRVRELAQLTRSPDEVLWRFPAQLSGGQRQRVALMRALMLDPDVLLLDEPLGALDPMIRADLQDDLRQVFCLLTKTVVLVTHDLAEAGFFADTVVLLREGEVVQQGSFEQLLATPSNDFVARFVRAQRRPLEALTSVSVDAH